MALIKCPECGRENVSDSAESCPDCGFCIKAYFEEKKRKEEEEIREEKKRQEEILRQAELNLQREENAKRKKAIEEERIRREEEQKDKRKKWIKKYKKFIILGIILILASGITVCVKNQIYINNTNAQVDEAVKKNLKADMEKMTSKMKNSCQIYFDISDMNISYSVTREKRSLHKATYICKYTLNFNNIDQYKDAEYNGSDASLLFSALQQMYEHKEESFKYSVKNIADVNVILKSDFDNGLMLKDDNNNFLRYVTITDDVYYNDTRIYNDDEYNSENNAKADEDNTPPLSITDKDLKYDDGYYYCTGTVHNNSSATLYYVQIRVTYYNSSGEVLTTDTTYAVGSEGIRSGENQQFETMTDVNGKVDKYKVEVMDYTTD